MENERGALDVNDSIQLSLMASISSAADPFNREEMEDDKEQVALLIGSGEGFVHIAGGVNDSGDPLNWKFRVPCVDGGDPRAKKQFGDIVYDMNTNSTDVTVTPYTDNYTTAQAPATYNTPARQLVAPQGLGAGEGVQARNIGVEISGSIS